MSILLLLTIVLLLSILLSINTVLAAAESESDCINQPGICNNNNNNNNSCNTSWCDAILGCQYYNNTNNCPIYCWKPTNLNLNSNIISYRPLDIILLLDTTNYNNNNNNNHSITRLTELLIKIESNINTNTINNNNRYSLILIDNHNNHSNNSNIIQYFTITRLSSIISTIHNNILLYSNNNSNNNSNRIHPYIIFNTIELILNNSLSFQLNYHPDAQLHFITIIGLFTNITHTDNSNNNNNNNNDSNQYSLYSLLYLINQNPNQNLINSRLSFNFLLSTSNTDTASNNNNNYYGNLTINNSNNNYHLLTRLLYNSLNSNDSIQYYLLSKGIYCNIINTELLLSSHSANNSNKIILFNSKLHYRYPLVQCKFFDSNSNTNTSSNNNTNSNIHTVSIEADGTIINSNNGSNNNNNNTSNKFQSSIPLFRINSTITNYFKSKLPSVPVEIYNYHNNTANDTDRFPTTDNNMELLSKLIDNNRPIILRNNPIIAQWPSYSNWSWSSLIQYFHSNNNHHSNNLVFDIKQQSNNISNRFTDIDLTAELIKLNLYNLTQNYTVINNMTIIELFELITKNNTLADRDLTMNDYNNNNNNNNTDSNNNLFEPVESNDILYYYFGRYSPTTINTGNREQLFPINDCKPNSIFYNTIEDLMLDNRFIWASSAGVQMHTHFDSDHNLFIQILGQKRFYLLAPELHRLMAIYPRLSPLWHKSQLDFNSPDLELFLNDNQNTSNIDNLLVYTADLYPGDILFIPSYWWHSVESVSASLSLSTWSNNNLIRDTMDTIYRYDQHFDKFHNPAGRIYALRLYIDLLINSLYGYNQTSIIIQTLIDTRYKGLLVDLIENINNNPHNQLNTIDQLFNTNNPSSTPLCSNTVPIPTSESLLASTRLDISIIVSNFNSIKSADYREILLFDYLDELIVNLVGIRNLVKFYNQCFQGQSYRLTDSNTGEHAELWNYRDIDEYSSPEELEMNKPVNNNNNNYYQYSTHYRSTEQEIIEFIPPPELQEAYPIK